MPDDIDVFGDAEMPVNENGLGQLSKLYAHRANVSQTIEELKIQIKQAEGELREIDEKRFPDLFDQVGVTSFRVGNREISINEKLYGSLPSSAEASAYLREQGGSGLFKTMVDVAFARGESEKARQLVERLEAAGLEPNLKESVHPQTLQAWTREQLAAGKMIDLDKLGLYNRRYVVVK